MTDGCSNISQRVPGGRFFGMGGAMDFHDSFTERFVQFLSLGVGFKYFLFSPFPI